MTLDEFIERFIEGYLFHDLREMAKIRVPEYGGCGYPMVLTTLAGIELLGVLTAEKEYSDRHGDNRFREFWQGYLYPTSPERKAMADLMYQLVRNALAHTYMTKPVIEVTKAHHGHHLCRVSDEKIVLDALTFAEELETAYTVRVKPKMEGAFKDKMTARYNQFRDAYRKDHETWQRTVRRVPLGSPSTRVGHGHVLAPNSPTVPPSCSTSVSGEA